MRVAVVNGPNLNWLGRREPDLYGHVALAELNRRVAEHFRGRVELDFFQANGEGEIIDYLQQAGDHCDGVVINPGAYGHYSLAIADALAALPVPVVEVHLTNVFSREGVRHRQLTAASCQGYICGLGWRGYILAVQVLTEIIEEAKNENAH